VNAPAPDPRSAQVFPLPWTPSLSSLTWSRWSTATSLPHGRRGRRRPVALSHGQGDWIGGVDHQPPRLGPGDIADRDRDPLATAGQISQGRTRDRAPKGLVEQSAGIEGGRPVDWLDDHGPVSRQLNGQATGAVQEWHSHHRVPPLAHRLLRAAAGPPMVPPSSRLTGVPPRGSAIAPESAGGATCRSRASPSGRTSTPLELDVPMSTPSNRSLTVIPRLLSATGSSRRRPKCPTGRGDGEAQRRP
jgi:hypothetical protein